MVAASSWLAVSLRLSGKPGVPHRTPVRGLWFIGSQSESAGNVIQGAAQAALRCPSYCGSRICSA
ncbi:MAG: hypothetical protein HY699_03630 [Deltaproteobacteria bacterium]|nr:hypothetical protein [Deltaproteobacteria bacterium]